MIAISMLICTSLILTPLLVRAVSPINITIDSNFAGNVDILVDGVYISGPTPQIYSWTPTATHTLNAITPLTYGPTFRRIFQSWTSPSIGTVLTNSFTYNVPGSAETVKANFQDQWFITVVSPHGSPTPSTWVPAGTDFTASVTSPDYPWVCTGYSIDGGPLTAGISYKFTAVNSAHTITFYWIQWYHLTVLTYGDGLQTMPGATTPPSGWYAPGAHVTLTAVPTLGSYAFHYWSVNGDFMKPPDPGPNPITITMNENKLAIAWYKDPPFMDFNGNGPVDFADLVLMAHHLGAHRGDANYNKLYDLNGDGFINLLDLATVARAIIP
jgi:hypothetical protein